MDGWRRSRWTNPATWYTSGGVVLLAASLWLPWAAASRTARTEQRAADIAALLLEAARGDSPPASPADLDCVMARFERLAAARDVFTSDLERHEAPPDALLLLSNKHYAFQLAPSPPPPNERVGRDTTMALEVVAWPLSAVGPGHCAFFEAEDAPRAYSRNLGAGYAGLDRGRPRPGYRHRAANDADDASYRALDDERWLRY